MSYDFYSSKANTDICWKKSELDMENMLQVVPTNSLTKMFPTEIGLYKSQPTLVTGIWKECIGVDTRLGQKNERCGSTLCDKN